MNVRVSLGLGMDEEWKRGLRRKSEGRERVEKEK